MPFPKVVKVCQEFPRSRVVDVEQTLREQFEQEEIGSRIEPGMEIALTAGSREISNIRLILRSLVQLLEEAGAKPFIVPAMGSHGGATAEGQVEILESLGVTEESVGAEIRSSMETVELGETDRGTIVYMDRRAVEAEGVIVVGRIKLHTDFRSEIESGLCKMGRQEERVARVVPGPEDGYDG